MYRREPKVISKTEAPSHHVIFFIQRKVADELSSS